jgi:hypothetical protein
MKPVVKSEFKEWFVQQFGKRPSQKALHILAEEVAGLEKASSHARYLYNQALLYDSKMTVALYAWGAREKILKERVG